jgi:hypothetical protein
MGWAVCKKFERLKESGGAPGAEMAYIYIIYEWRKG